MVNRAGNPESLGVTRLGEGEITRTFRARARVEVWEWATKLTAEERGQIFTDAFKALEMGRTKTAVPDPISHHKTRDTETLSNLMTARHTLPDPLPSLTPKARDVLELLREGAYLARQHGQMLYEVRSLDRSTVLLKVAKNTVHDLLAAGLLATIEDDHK